MAWTDLTFNFGAILTSTQMTQLDDNFDAMAAGDAGAPSIQLAAMAADAVDQTVLKDNSVGRGELLTTTASGTTNVGATSGASISLTGGNHSWWTLSASNAAGAAFGNGNVAAGVIGVHNALGSSRDFYRDERYVQSSPPYNLGDGDIPLFIELNIEKVTGKILGVDVSPDPLFAYHGPTNIAAQRMTRDGRKYRTYSFVEDTPLYQAMRDPQKAERIMKGEIEIEDRELEITHAIKNADMNEFPHHWHLNDTSNSEILLLNPVSPILERLLKVLEDEGAWAVRDLMLNGYLVYGNTPIARATPNGVTPVPFRWKNTV